MTVSTRLFSQQMLGRFERIEEELQLRQTKIASGEAITQASDDPMGAVRLSALTERTEQIGRYQANLDTARQRLSLGDTTLETADNILARVRELALNAATDTTSDGGLQAIRVELIEQRDALLSLANTRDTADQALFGGYATDRTPFAEGPDGRIRYEGDGGEHTLAASESMRIPTSVNGAEVFMQVETGDGVESVFDVIDGLIAAIGTAGNFASAVTAPAEAEVNLTIAADRMPREWNFRLTGPAGSADISATVLSGALEDLHRAIAEAAGATGISATLSADGQRITLAAEGGQIGVSALRIEGVTRASADPRAYLELTAADGGARIGRVAPEVQTIGAQLSKVTAAGDAIAVSRTTLGARLARAENQETVLAERLLLLQREVADLAVADLETVITELQTLLTNRDAARQAYSRVGQQTLFDFLN